MKHVKALDSLRAFAVFAVIVFHWSHHSIPGSTTNLLKRVFIPNAGFGVDLFFVLSGFLITQILLNAREKGEGKHKLHIIKNFVIRRTLRIFPVYFLLLYILYAINFSETRQYFVYYLTYTANIIMYIKHSWCGGLAHTWSLSVEEQFYLFWPWLVVFSPRKYLKYLFPATIVVGVISTYFFYHLQPIITNDDPTKASILTPACLGAFGMGAMLAYLRMFDRERLALFTKALNILAPIALVAYFFQEFRVIETIQWRLIDGILSLWLINYALTPRQNVFYKHVLENRVLIFIGKISYGMYLFHNIIPYYYSISVPFKMKMITHSDVVFDLFNNFYFSFVVLFLLLVLVSWLSFELFEKQILKLKNRFEYN